MLNIEKLSQNLGQLFYFEYVCKGICYFSIKYC